MFWRIGFSTASSLDTLLEKPNVTVEEILDDADLLQECKSQNSKLVELLQQPRIIQRLLEHVVGTAEVAGDGGAEWEEKVRFKYPYMASEVLSSDIWAILDTILAHQDELLRPFWNSVLSANPSHAEPPLTHFTHPLLNRTAQQNASAGSSSSSAISLNSTGKRTINAQENGPGRSVLAGYWAKVNGVFLDKKPLEMLAFIRSLPRSVDRFIAHLETPAVVDLLYRMIQLEEATPEAGTIEWLADNGLVGKLVDLLSPRHSADLHLTVSELFKAVIAFSAPSATNLAQTQSADAFGGGGAFGGAESFASGRPGGTNNRLVRELASEEQIRKMVHFMLDMGPEKREDAHDEGKPDASSSGTEQGGEGTPANNPSDNVSDAPAAPPSSAHLPLRPSDQPASETASLNSQHRLSDVNDEDFPTVRAPEVEISTETMTSSLVTCIGVLIELIRKNNSDYFEQHLFHTLRQYLIQRQQDFTQERHSQAFNAADTSLSQSSDSEDMHRRLSNTSFQDPSEDEQLEAMEQAMNDFPSKLGIVHLGPMLEVLCERLPEFQHLLMNPRSSNAPRKTTLGELAPLTFERYRITELYAELLHCSNMALLNRTTGNGPQYSEQGNLLGGVDGFQMLARTMGVPDDTEAADESTQEGAAPASVTSEVSVSKETDPADKDGSATTSASDNAESTAKVLDEPRPAGLHARGKTQHHRYESTTDSSTSSNGTEDEATARDASSGGQTPTLQASPPLAQGDGEEGKGSVTPTPPAAPEVTTETPPEATTETPPATVTETTSTEESVPSNTDSPNAVASDANEKPPISNVGDLLKQKFINCNIVPSLLTLFFEFPWNNFLHNVVYDILQQFFNGRMDIGLNRQLTIDVFRNGRLTDKIVEGHKRNEESSRGPRRIRLGYMGHMNLIAEETVKLLERYQSDIAEPVRAFVKQPDWDNFVNQSLRENREREAAPLAGGPPVAGRNLSLGASSAEDDDDGPNIMNDNTFASYLSSQMGTGGSDDDDSDEEGSWLSAGVGSSGQRSGDFEDAFAPPSMAGIGTSSDSHEDEWGPFADSSDAGGSFQSAFSQETNLTPADWSRDFRRAFDEEDGDIETSAFDANDSESATPTPTSPQNNVPFVDLFDPAAVRRSTEASTVAAAAAAAALAAGTETGEATILEVLTIPAPTTASSQSGIRPRSRTSSVSSNSSSGSNAAAATDEASPLGPGVSPDTELTSEGKLKRVIDGREVIAPLDDVAVAAAASVPPSGSSTGGDVKDALGTVSTPSS